MYNSLYLYRNLCKMSFVPETFIIYGFLWSLVVFPAFANFSLYNYGNSAYPNCCVVDIDSTRILLKMGQKFRPKFLPCTTILCIGDGYGMLFTCDKKEPPEHCHFKDYLNGDANYPDCCYRKLECD
uniref:AT25815p n=1 Tax=Drosophila melanogaster TaxID=7227 RepID=Q6NN97_DROME|nr:AT25815p [Drosophila melanogaster]